MYVQQLMAVIIQSSECADMEDEEQNHNFLSSVPFSHSTDSKRDQTISLLAIILNDEGWRMKILILTGTAFSLKSTLPAAQW